MSLRQEITEIARKAQEASHVLAQLPSAKKDAILKEMASRLLKNRNSVLRANKKDMTRARHLRRSAAFLERLVLSEKRIKEMAGSLVQISRLKDPVGQLMKAWTRPNGLRIHKVRVPIGVVAIIYESRPNVTSDCIGLLLKSAEVPNSKKAMLY